MLYSFSENLVMNEWGKLRENFRKCLQRRKAATRSGAPGKQLSTCLYFKELSFLTDVIGVRNTTSNLNISQNYSSSNKENTDLAPQTTPPHPTNTHMKPKESIISSTPKAPNDSKRGMLKRKANDPVETLLTKALVEDLSKKPDEDCTDTLFCKSLVESLKKLSSKKNKQAKIKIMQILLDMEDDE